MTPPSVREEARGLCEALFGSRFMPSDLDRVAQALLSARAEAFSEGQRNMSGENPYHQAPRAEEKRT